MRAIWNRVSVAVACAHESGANPFVTHGMCYAAGGAKAPVGTLSQCYEACKQ